MQTLARFAVQRRWWVVAGWIAFIIGAQALLAGLGGANYKDDFKLPHTETQTVAEPLWYVLATWRAAPGSAARTPDGVPSVPVHA